jgi:prepilin signal peptidase PulO-like enzyme (type II secretory pathway)
VLLLIIIFVIGLLLGSFLLVVASRLPRGESFLSGRSYCEYCKHVLQAKDLVPVVSFLSTGGRCRYCKKKLSMEYPVSEIITGTLFASTYYFAGFSTLQCPMSNVQCQMSNVLLYVFYFFIVSVLIIIFFADLKYYIIPFQILLPTILIVLFWHLYNQPENDLNYLASGIGAFLLFLLIFLITRGRGMGFGDVVYAFFMGILLGFPNIVVGLYVAFLTGAAVSIILIIKGKKKLKGGVIPFGPFLIFGTYLALFWGDILSRYILNFLYR